MPNVDRIDSLADVPALESEFKIIIGNLKTVKNSIADIGRIQSLAQGAKSLKELREVTDQLNKSKAQSVVIEKRLAEVQDAKRNALQKIQLKEQNDQLKLQAQLQNSVAGSVEHAALMVKSLNYQLSILNVTTDAGKKKQDDLTQSLLKYQSFISANKPGGAVAAGGKLSDRPISSIPFEIASNPDKVNQTDHAVVQLERDEAAAAMTANEWAAAQRNAASAVEASTIADEANNIVVYKDELEKLTGTLDENQALQRIYKKELSEISTELKLMDKTTSAAEKSTEAYRTKVANLTDQQTKLKAESKDLDKTIQNQTREQNAAAGSVDRLRARYALLLRELERGGDAFKKTSVGKQIALEAVTVKTELDKQERTMLNFKGSLTNTGSAIVGFAGKAFSFLRNIAYLIPGLGLAGLIGAIVDPVIDLAKGLFTSSDAAEKLALNIDKISTAGDKAKEVMADLEKHTEFLERLGDINLNINFTGDFNRSLLDANAKMLDLNDTALELNKQSADLKTNYSAAFNLIRDEGSDAAQELIRKYTMFKDIPASAIESLGKDSKKIVEAGKKAEKDYFDFQDKLVDNSNKKIILSAQIRQLKSDDTRKVDKDNIEFTIRERNREAKVSSDLYIHYQNDIIKANDEILKSDLYSASRKIIAVKESTKAEAKIIAEQRRFALTKGSEDLDILNTLRDRGLIDEKDYNDKRTKIQFNTAAELEKIDHDYYEGLRENERKSLRDILEIQIRKRAELAKLIEETKGDADREAAGLHAAEEERTKKRVDSVEADFAKRLVSIQTAGDIELAKYTELYNRRKITKEKLGHEELKVEKQMLLEGLEAQVQHDISLLIATKETGEQRNELADGLSNVILKTEKKGIKARLEAELDYYEVLIKSEKLTGKALIDAENLVAVIRLKIKKQSTKDADEDTAKVVEGINRIKGIYTNLNDLLGGVLDAQATKKKNAIQAQIDDIDRLSAAEIDSINRSVLSTQEKADRISAIEAKAAAQKAILEQKQRQIDQRKAMFDKATAIVNIILGTAVSVAQAKGLFEKIAIAALGAAQLAVAIATPIPKYRYGTGDGVHPGGKAMVGDGWKHEALIYPDGTIMKSAASPVVMDLPEGTIVEPDFDRTMMRLAMTDAPEYRPNLRYVGVDNTKSIERMEKNVVSAIKSKPVLNLAASEGGMAAMWKHLASKVKYINDQTNW